MNNSKLPETIPILLEVKNSKINLKHKLLLKAQDFKIEIQKQVNT